MAEINYGARLKLVRTSRNIKQKEMAELLGIKQSRYCNYENNYVKIPVDIMVKFCEINDIDINVFTRKDFVLY